MAKVVTTVLQHFFPPDVTTVHALSYLSCSPGADTVAAFLSTWTDDAG